MSRSKRGEGISHIETWGSAFPADGKQNGQWGCFRKCKVQVWGEREKMRERERRGGNRTGWPQVS